MLVQYVRKTQAVHRSHKGGSGETGLIFTDHLALSKSLPFPAPLFLPTHHLPCLFRSQAFRGSRLSCLALVEVPTWGSLPCHQTDSSRSCIQHRADMKWWLERARLGNWAVKRDRLLVRQEHVSSASVCEGEAMLTVVSDPSVCLPVQANLICLHWTPLISTVVIDFKAMKPTAGLVLVPEHGTWCNFLPVVSAGDSFGCRKYWDCQCWWPWLKTSQAPEPRLTWYLKIICPVRREQRFPHPDGWTL